MLKEPQFRECYFFDSKKSFRGHWISRRNFKERISEFNLSIILEFFLGCFCAILWGWEKKLFFALQQRGKSFYKKLFQRELVFHFQHCYMAQSVWERIRKNT